MSFRVLSLASPEPIEIIGYDSIVVSDPAFERSLTALAAPGE